MNTPPCRQFACPQCGSLHQNFVPLCAICGLPLEWIAGLERFQQALAVPRNQSFVGTVPLPLEALGTADEPFSLNLSREVILGRDIQQCTHSLHHEQIERLHCVIVRQPGSEGARNNSYWIADAGTSSGTYINNQRIWCQRLASGDFVQIGPFAWTFSRDGFLVPAPPVCGIGLILQGVRLYIHKFAEPLDLQIRKGEFVAVVGRSGEGKSTLLKALLGISGTRRAGKIMALDGSVKRDVDEERGWYRGVLGYVSQESVLHDRLTPREALEFSAELRGAPKDPQDIEETLRNAELLENLNDPESVWDRPIYQLSGGENKRVRTAAELVSQPRLLFLDEPASGLDFEREAGLMRHLRSLSFRGCTIVLITHSRDHLALVDRRLEVGGGKIKSIATLPTAAAHAEPQAVGDTVSVGALTTGSEADEHHGPKGYSGHNFSDVAPRGLAQVWVLLRREWRLLSEHSAGRGALQSLLRGKLQSAGELLPRILRNRLVFPILVGGLFAVVLGIGVRQWNPHLLGFLSLLACIWMGSSLSLLAIAGEREVFDHERYVFLRIPCYLVAKFLVLAGISTLQTVVFCSALWILRRFLFDGAEAPLAGIAWVLGTLILVGWNGVALGLLISAAARRRRDWAGFILPLVILMQMVFSVEVATDKGDSNIDPAYTAGFHFHRCANTQTCQRRATKWVPAGGLWLCDSCGPKYRELSASPDADGEDPRHILARVAKNRRETPHEDQQANLTLPHVWGACLSYLTLSRYADVALRSFAYDASLYESSQKPPREDRSRDEYFVHGYGEWFWGAIGVLMVTLAGMLLATGCVLWVQSREWRRFAPSIGSRIRWGVPRRTPLSRTENTHHGS